MAFQPRDFREILSDKIAYIISNSPLTDVNPGSVLSTISEATSLEDAEQYFQMLEIIRNYSLNSTSGADLDKRAQEYGLTRNAAVNASTVVTIGDSSFDKIQTKIYAGLPGPKAGNNYVYADSATDFPTSGALIIGRGTNNVETIAYVNIITSSNYVQFVLSGSLSNDHGTDETIILSQGGNRIIPAGTIVYVPENDISGQVSFSVDNDTTLLDGEVQVELVAVTAMSPGKASNVPAGLITEFSNKPFSTATVTNPIRVTNGKDSETDAELRDRIKLHIQSLSRGVSSAILGAIIGLTDSTTNRSVVSANIIQATDANIPSVAVIDDGTGFEPTYSGQGYETIIPKANGGEQILQLEYFPIVKAFVISQNKEPYNLTGTTTLNISINGTEETLTFNSTYFTTPSQATAEEVIKAINLQSQLAEARTINAGTQVFLQAKAISNEDIKITGGTANSILKFPTTENKTLYLYKNYRTLLNKDGITASIESGNTENYSFANNDAFIMNIDGKSGYQKISFQNTDVTAELVSSRINTQLQGAVANTSSNGTKVLIISNTEDSALSSIKIGRDSIVTSASSNTTFYDTSLSTDFPYVDQIKGLRVKMTSGALIGNAQLISSYNPTTGQIVLSSSIGGTPSINDTFIIDGPAIGNVGNPATSTNKLNFSTNRVTGANKDYTLNRMQGQFELSSPLSINDIITAGTPYTRAEVTTASMGDYVFGSSSTLLISVDGGSTQTITISAGTYSASQLAILINTQLLGARAIVNRDNTSKLTLRSNNWIYGTGSIQVLGGTANSILGFSTTKDTSLIPHISYLISQNAYNQSGATEYTFADSSNLIIIMDNSTGTPYTVTMSLQGTVTYVGSLSTFRDSSLISPFTTTDMFKDFFCKFTSGANLNEMRIVSSYNPVNGEIVLTTNLSNPVSINDTFVLIPRTAKNISIFLNNTTITGLSLKASIEESADNKVILSSLNSGTSGAVNVTGGSANSYAMSFLTNGTNLGTFTTNSLVGIMVGQEVTVGSDNVSEVNGFITGISGTNPYTVTISTDRTGTTPIDLSAYITDHYAYIRPRNLLNFSTTAVSGIDAYSYYTGLLQKVQWTIDGREDDPVNYPGVKAAGTQIETKPPIINRIRVIANITTVNGVSLTSIAETIKSAISNYINNLGVAKDVVISEIITTVMNVSGVYDCEIVEPASNIAVGDMEIVRVYESDIIVG